jgi:hypothetical protein
VFPWLGFVVFSMEDLIRSKIEVIMLTFPVVKLVDWQF